MKNKVLIIGKIPPPVGGVTVHVLRLLNDLRRKEYTKADFYNLQTGSIGKLFFRILRYKAVHLHVSHPGFQLLAACICKLVNTRLIITYHGNLGRYGLFQNFLTIFSVKIAFIPVVQNQESLAKASVHNKNAILISAFIRPVELLPLSDANLEKLLDFRKTYTYLFCTNAGNLSFDKNGDEIYGISALVNNLKAYANAALVISDPSGKYCSYIKSNLTVIPQNIHFISEVHDFLNVLPFCDAFIRNTTTDGDSISIHEAIACGIPVFASDCVSRPKECILFADVSNMDFREELVKRSDSEPEMPLVPANPDVTSQLIMLYNQCL